MNQKKLFRAEFLALACGFLLAAFVSLLVMDTALAQAPAASWHAA